MTRSRFRLRAPEHDGVHGTVEPWAAWRGVRDLKTDETAATSQAGADDPFDPVIPAIRQGSLHPGPERRELTGVTGFAIGTQVHRLQLAKP
jgi:hypothetical protein